MIEFLKLVVIFTVIVVGLRRKIFVGYLLFGAGILTAILYGAAFDEILRAYTHLLISTDFLALYAIIILITFLGRFLREIGYLDRLVKASEEIIGGARTASAVLPAMIGLMPMPGGALLSAPLIGRVLKDKKYSPEFKTVVNYWSRHVIEFCWPVYPGLILSATITSLPVGTVSLLQMPMTLIMILIGIVFFIRKIDPSNGPGGKLIKPLFSILVNIWPIILAILIHAIFEIKLVFCVLIALILLLLIERPTPARLLPVAKEAFSPRLLVLVYGVLSFKAALEVTGAVGSIPKLTAELGLSPQIMIILVSFLSGLLTGILFALIGLAYPLLAAFLYQPDINLANIFLAFVSGYVGMIFSPTHFCLILTNEHFKSHLGKVYRLLTPPLLLLFLTAVFLYLIGYPWHIF
nr:DUF401 family protein [candidate division Zixibacteria bacterium]